MRKRFCSFILLVLLVFAGSFASEPLRVLAIGNSFSVDALEQEMYPLAVAGGKQIVIGNLYIPGCPVERHYNNMKYDRQAYSYRKIGLDGRVDTIPDCPLSKALLDEKWDYITFQQASGVSGIYDSYAKLPELISMVRNAVGSHPVFLWHMTWAYSPDSTHCEFKNYDNDQMKMYESIVGCVRRVLAENPEIKGIIPCGTAIQDARTSALGRNLTADGYHLSRDEGRYIASCTWYAVLFGEPVLGNSYVPGILNSEQVRIAQAAADTAVKEPFSITQIR